MENFKKKFANALEVLENRELVLSIFLILIGVIFIIQLFNIQIINGASYREQAENKIVRNETVPSSRGEIYDRNGVVLATNKLTYNVELYRTKVGIEETNNAIRDLVDILVSNGDAISSSFPVNDNGDNFSQEYLDDGELREEFLKNIKLEKDATFNDVIDYYTELYAVEDYDYEDKLKIIKVKYEANQNGYSLFNGAIISKNISKNSVAQIEELKSRLYGVNIVSVPQRYYVSDTFASHIIGYVSKISTEEYKNMKDNGYTINSLIGKAGIEESMEKYLKGTDGVKKVVTDSFGNVSSEQITQDAVAGNNVYLTIDYRIQQVVENSLVSCLEGLRNGSIAGKIIPQAYSGSVVVLDVETGEVLAMASYPNYNINSFVNGISTQEWNALNNDEQKPMFNRAISGTYSPGSTYKMLVGISGLESGAITTEEYINDPGIYPYAYNPKCWIYSSYMLTHGNLKLAEAIKVSCNCYFYEVGRRVGIKTIVDWAKNFGLGRKTGIELSGEASGNIAGENEETWSLGDTLSASIGQSTNLYTPLQLANYISTIANGGRLNKVSVIKSVENDITSLSITQISEFTKQFTGVDFEAKDLNISKYYIDTIKEGMYAVTTDTGGTAQFAFLDSKVEVAGKTGTAQVANGDNNAIFLGFAPYNNPKIAVVAVVEHGDQGHYLAPMVKEIINSYFDIYTTDSKTEKNQDIVNNRIEF